MQPIELRHTLQEKLGMSGAIALYNFLFYALGKYFGSYNNLSWLHLACINLAVGLLVYISMSRQFLRVDDDGLCVRYILLTRRVRWHEVKVLLADWSEHFEGLASSYGVNSWMGFLTFKGHNNKTLLKVKINCGPIRTRRQIKAFIEQKLQERIYKP